MSLSNDAKSIGRDLEADLSKLADAFFDNLQIDNCEFGGLGVDCKRPFGNSDAEGDILEIIGVKENHYRDEYTRYAFDLYHQGLIPYLRKRWTDKK